MILNNQNKENDISRLLYQKPFFGATFLMACLSAFLAAGMSLMLIACGSNSDSREKTPGLEELNQNDRILKIVTTTTQATDLFEILTAGSRGIELFPLMGAGVDPHLYQPTESDIAAMNNADVVIYSGLHLEGQFDTVFEALRERGVIIYAMSKGVKDAGFVIGSFDQRQATLGSDDPHFWFDPRNWSLVVQDAAGLLARLSPDQSGLFMTHAEAYREELELLYDWADKGMRSVPGGQRYLVTSHDAFQYFGAAFGWLMAAIQGISTQDEAGVGDIQGTVDFVMDKDIPVLFVESSISPNTIQAVVEAIRSQGGRIQIGVREMFGDAMGEPGSFGGTYIGMIATNVLTVLQSYELAGARVEIPQWPAEISLKVPASLLSAN